MTGAEVLPPENTKVSKTIEFETKQSKHAAVCLKINGVLGTAVGVRLKETTIDICRSFFPPIMTDHNTFSVPEKMS